MRILALPEEQSNDHTHEHFEQARRINNVLQQNPHLNAESLNANRIYIENSWELEAEGTWIDVDKGASAKEILEKLEATIVDEEAANKMRAI